MEAMRDANPMRIGRGGSSAFAPSTPRLGRTRALESTLWALIERRWKGRRVSIPSGRLGSSGVDAIIGRAPRRPDPGGRGLAARRSAVAVLVTSRRFQLYRACKEGFDGDEAGGLEGYPPGGTPLSSRLREDPDEPRVAGDR